MEIRGVKQTALVLCGLILVAILMPQSSHPLLAAPLPGTIAYVRADTLDEIRLIEPDGSKDRRLWTHGQADPENVYQIRSVAWRPDAREIAFASSHEFECSVNESDVFVIANDGSNERRITQAPACAGLAGLPKGAVSVPVQNSSGESLTGFLYFQGARSAQSVALPPGGSGLITFLDVADFGDTLQMPVLIMPLEGGRQLGFAAAADIQPGGTVRTSTLFLSGAATIGREARWPTWRSDSSQLGYVFGFNSLYRIDPNPSPLEDGDKLVSADWSALPDFADHLAWGPMPAHANEILYAGNDAFDSEDIYLIAEGSANRGQQLVSYEANQFIRGLAWLPDSSGFVYSVIETEFFEPKRANLFEYDFASKQVTRLTNFGDEFAGQLSVSPDSQQIIFERSASKEDGAPTDLWVMNRDGAGLRLLVHNGARPSWSQRAIQVPNKIYLPFVRR
jgi:hypothetical protein